MTFLALLAVVGAMVGNRVAALWEAAGSHRARYGRALWLQAWFLAGLIADIAAWALTVVALRFLPVFAVQAILAGADRADHTGPQRLESVEPDPAGAVRRGRGARRARVGRGQAAPDRPEHLPPVAMPVLLAGFAGLLVLTPVVWPVRRTLTV